MELSTLGGSEGETIIVFLSARVSGVNGIQNDKELVLHITAFPRGSLFNKGSFNGTVWTFTRQEFGEIELTLPPFLSGDIILTAVANNSGITREGTLRFIVEAVANSPDLIVGEACFDITTGSVNLSIDSSLVDNDGSEILTIMLLNIPDNAIPSVGQMIKDGEYILTSEDLANATLKFVGNFGTFDITASSSSTEMMNLAVAYTNAILFIQECDKCNLGTHNCDQICINIDGPGSFICDCNTDYELNSNGYSCDSKLILGGGGGGGDCRPSILHKSSNFSE